MTEPGMLDDLSSDMSAFHRIRDIGAMRAPVLARLASRIAVYKGAVAASRSFAASQPQQKPARDPQRPAPPRRRDPGPVVPAAQLAGLLAPQAGSLIWGEVTVVKPRKPDGGNA